MNGKKIPSIVEHGIKNAEKQKTQENYDNETKRATEMFTGKTIWQGAGRK